VKSCQGIRVETAKFNRLGLVHDRRWMIVSKDFQFLSQRTYPNMALIKQKLVNSHDEIDFENPEYLILEAPDASPLRIRINDEDKEKSEQVVTVTLWEKPVKARLVGQSSDEWITSILGRPCHLVTLISTEKHERPISPKFDRNPAGTRIQAAFSDGYPILLASTRSFEEVRTGFEEITAQRIKEEETKENKDVQENTSIKRKYDINFVPSIVRFRPNIVVSGDLKPWVEDRWKHISVGGRVNLKVAKPCDRCTVPDVEHTAGVRDPNLSMTKTLRAFRSSNMLGGKENAVYFGINIIHDSAAINQVLHIGDNIIILDEGKPQYPY